MKKLSRITDFVSLSQVNQLAYLPFGLFPAESKEQLIYVMLPLLGHWISCLYEKRD